MRIKALTQRHRDTESKIAFLCVSVPLCQRRTRGSALLSVLWLSAALSAIVFSLASTVRGEGERTSTALDGLRSYYLAVGAVQRARIELLWSVQFPNRRPIPQGATVLDYQFPSGRARVELIPEASKLNVNEVPVQDLNRLIVALGIEPGRAQEIAAAIDDYRRAPEGGSRFDQHYLSLTPSFQAPHASLQEIEELLLVKGVTPDIFYGTYVPGDGAGPRLVPRGGLIECLSVYGSKDKVDANTATPAVLTAIGLSRHTITALLERRRTKPLTQAELGGFMESVGGSADRLRTEGNSIITIRATAQLQLPNGELSDLRRTVSAVTKYMQPGADSAVEFLRWYDTAWSN
jgi:general secretion pathway protein K